MNRPFMEHPSNETNTPVEAMEDAIERLRALPNWDKWITFCAQGMAGRVDTYRFASIRMREGAIVFLVQNNRLEWTEKALDLDIPAVTSSAGVAEHCLSRANGGYSVAEATPEEAAKVMDVIFRQYMDIHPHTGEGDNYGVSAEW